MSKTYQISYKRGSQYKSITKTFKSDEHLCRYVDVMQFGGSKVIDTFLKD